MPSARAGSPSASRPTKASEARHVRNSSRSKPSRPRCAFLGPCGSALLPTAPPQSTGSAPRNAGRSPRVAVPGPVASEADRLAEELEHYDRLLEANPNLERAWSNRAKVLDKLGRTKEAAESLAKAAELNPAREEQYRLDVQNILRSKEDASVIAPQWKQPAPTAAPKVVDTHLIEALEHYDSLLRADPSLVVAWRTN